MKIYEEIKIIENIPQHCNCCGFKSNNLIGPFKFGPYKYVCENCYNLEYVWYPKNADNEKIGTLNIASLAKRIPQKILLVEPDYYSKFPPLGLLKIGAYHLDRGDIVELLRIKEQRKKLKKLKIKYNPSKFEPPFYPEIIYITSLFTWAWLPVWEAVQYYHNNYPDSKIYLGGIYASILPDHAILSGADFVNVGLIKELEHLKPAYDLVPEWNGSIIFASRGCKRNCTFCVVPKIEGQINSEKQTILPFLNPLHTKAYFWDNNILAADNKDIILDELSRKDYQIDFNQGIDARLVTPELAQKLAKLHIPILHLAYDSKSARAGVKRAIKYLKIAGFSGRRLVFYTLYNFKDTPQDFLERLRDLMNWGVVSYPMRFEPLNSLKKNQYVSKNWTAELLEMIAKARRVMGFGGAFPPYETLVKKINDAKDLFDAMKLRSPK